jgi:hypothetical protein
MLDAEEAGWLVEAVRVRVHERLGCGSVLEYLERVLGYGPRLAKERLRVAEALSQLPALRTCLANGELAWSAVRELSRVATPLTEAEWIAAARRKTVRQIEEMVSGRRSGDRPDDPADPSLRRHVLRLEISADALAAFREARRHLQSEVGHSLEDDELVRMLSHCALDGRRDPGRAAYQVAMTVCTECRRGARDGAGQVFAVETAQVDAALCDAQQVFIETQATRPVLDSSHADAPGAPRRRVDSEAARPDMQERSASSRMGSDHIEARSGEFELVPGSESLGASDNCHACADGFDLAPAVEIHGTSGNCRAGWDEFERPPGSESHATGNCQVCPGGFELTSAVETHVGRSGKTPSTTSSTIHRPARRPERPRPEPMSAPPVVPAATQTIPPRIRRLIWRRDHRRCKVPGCRAASWLEIHHIVPLSEGGDHDPSRMLLLCSAHHGRVHTGRLRIDGSAPGRLAFTHPNGAPFGDLDRAIDGDAIDADSELDRVARRRMEDDAVGALRRTGVSAGDARNAVAEAARAQPGTIEDLLRRAFAILGRTVYASRVSERQACYVARGGKVRRPPGAVGPIARCSFGDARVATTPSKRSVSIGPMRVGGRSCVGARAQ